MNDAGLGSGKRTGAAVVSPPRTLSGGYELLLTPENGGLSKLCYPVQLRFGAFLINATKIVWLIDARISELLSNPRDGVAWAKHGVVAPAGVDPDRFHGDFVKARGHCGPEQEVPKLTHKVRSALKFAGKEYRSLGLTQYLLDTSTEPVKSLEGVVRQVAEDPRCSSDAGARQVLRERQIQGVNTVNISQLSQSTTVARIKALWPNYDFGKGASPRHAMCKPAPAPQGCKACDGKQQVTVDGCDDIPDWVSSFATAILHATESKTLICKLSSINAALLNIYFKNQGSNYHLGLHNDSSHVFERFIYTLRLLSPAILSFATGGLRSNALAVKAQEPKAKGAGFPVYFDIPLPHGCLTEMTDFAANVLQHCVRPAPGTDGPSASLVLRHIHESLLSPGWLARNKVTHSRGSGS